MQASRRGFFKTAFSLGVASAAWPALSGCAHTPPVSDDLIPDPEGLLDLPKGFSYTTHSKSGEIMSDGLIVPGDHDGMACFPVEGDSARCILVRNHELGTDEYDQSAFAGGKASAEAIAKSYALNSQGQPLPGGTTTLVFNLRTQQVERSHLSLSGTIKNCSGGLTPWGSWLSCEETVVTRGGETSKDHGYMFEVPSAAKGLVDPVPLKSMGRFKREAAAVDPRTGIVYMTEDEHNSLFYRFIPVTPGTLIAGGKLQILSLKGDFAADTRNWTGETYRVGESWDVEWTDIDNVESPDGDLRLRGHAMGAALFARGEGMAWSVDPQGGAVFFACTNGGPAKRGQIWKYTPNVTGNEGGRLTLHFQSSGEAELDMCDNIVASPWGHIIVCEDGDNDQYVRGIAPEGRVYAIARNAHPDKNEFCGACFSPDGETLFVNMQTPGITFAIRGPWADLAIA